MAIILGVAINIAIQLADKTDDFCSARVTYDQAAYNYQEHYTQICMNHNNFRTLNRFKHSWLTTAADI